MKKVIMLEEGDYTLVMSALNAAQDVLARMRTTKNVRNIDYYVGRAITLLKQEDSSTRDLKDRIDSLERCMQYE